MSPRTLLFTVAAGTLLACSDGTGPQPALTLAQLAGTWDLTQFDLLMASDTTVKMDLKAYFDLSATLTTTAEGSARMVAWIQGSPPETTYATVQLFGDTIVYSATAGGSFEFTVTLASGSSRMRWLALYTDEWLDVDHDGAADETRERYAWHRR